MKNPKVGERCRKYYEETSYGKGSRLDGEIVRTNGDDVTVAWDRDKGKSGIMTKHHRTHLIRLKPKRKAREIWVNEYPIGLTKYAASTREEASDLSAHGLVRIVKFREVLSD